MTKPVSRRTFLVTTATALSGVACSALSPTQPTPEPGGPQTPPPAEPTPAKGERPPIAIPSLPLPGLFGGVEEPDGYIAVAPRVLRTGQVEAVSLSLFRGDHPATGDVTVSLVKSGRSLADGTGRVAGRGSVSLPVPKLADGDYEIRVSGKGFQDQAPIRVEEGLLLFVETDKPVYKPGQTVRIRVLGLDPALKPVGGEATVEVADAKGIKIFKRVAPIDDFGMAAVDLPLSTEPNLGVWKVRASSGKRASQVDVRVERYVLPKYEVKVELTKEWALASDPIRGTVGAEYSFGKPVTGEVEIVAERYVGTWQEYARVTRPIDGKVTFEVPAVRYATGSPAGRGMASVRLDVAVREQATGYEEKTSQLVTIAASPVSIRVIPESNTFKPSLPFSALVVAETPDRKPVDTTVQVRLTSQDGNFQRLKEETQQVTTRNGAALLKLTPPANAVALTIQATASGAGSPPTTIRAGYSPSGNFIRVEQVSQGALKVGDTAQFRVSSTRQAANFSYEVLSRGKVVFSDFSPSPDIRVTLTPLMAPEARLLVYQLLPNAEVAADYLPVKVEGSYPQAVQVSFDRSEAKPGDALDVRVRTEGAARVGLAAVDRSVFILAENRLNLRQVFDELERLYQKPQVELHDDRSVGPMPVPGPGAGVRGAPAIAPVAPGPGAFAGAFPDALPGARETFQDAGVVVLTNRQVPAGKQLQPRMMAEGVRAAAPAAAARPAAAPQPLAAQKSAEGAALHTASTAVGLAEVERVRQFFPETWLWTDLTTDASGRASHRTTAPDSITTWMFRAVALSKDKGLGIGEAELRVFQPFFVQVDLPYSAIRGEEFPAKVALYNYQTTAQDFTVDLDAADWFDLLDARSRSVTVGPNSVGTVAFTIRPTALGVRSLKVTARSRAAADAIVKELLVEPEGVQREVVENYILTPGAPRRLGLTVPALAIAGSPRAYLALTGNVLSQTIEGLEGLLRMPFGCGEQNMILFAPNVFIARYLKETGQLKPEVMAKAEKLMLTGYQRQLTYRRTDGSFSAFGQQDKEGSLWLTAFVLKTFAQARDLIFIDEGVLSSARDWIARHQNADGSFDPVGFVHHQELLGGLSGKTALTGFVAVALREAREDAASARAIRYLEGKLGGTDDAYSVAIATYALALAKSGSAPAARDKLMRLARESDEGLSWGDEPLPLPLGEERGEGQRGVQPAPAEGGARPAGRPGAPARPGSPPIPGRGRSASIETTGYATLALLQQGDRLNAGRAVRWLASRRNAYGGFGSTQDTVVALQAMATAASSSRADVDATVTLSAGAWRKDVRIAPDNADVLQIVEVPTDQTGAVDVEARGKGQVMAQLVHRFNVPSADQSARSPFQIDVRYSASQVEVNDLVTVTAAIRFTPPEPVAAGMVILDVAVPTGFEPVSESIQATAKREPKLKRFEVAGRKVILYIEDMLPDEQLSVTFQARALYPVRAQAVTSQAYSYYRPEWKGESLGGEVVVKAGR
ncbi:MAG: alpha-2-macroglobulin [Chloroflexi bacterium]|nr:alpha-2-macroglobulin [Chloroflexota bacterium]